MGPIQEIVDAPAQVAYATANDTAQAGSDYAQTAETLTLAAGSMSAAIRVPLINDTTPEPSETFLVNLGVTSGAALGAATSTAVTITDADAPPVFMVYMPFVKHSRAIPHSAARKSLVALWGSRGQTMPEQCGPNLWSDRGGASRSTAAQRPCRMHAVQAPVEHNGEARAVQGAEQAGVAPSCGP